MPIKQRTERLREKMKDRGVQAVVIYAADPHQSEYLPDHWKIREWVSGFTGSAGFVVIGLKKAGLWTDSRYFIQAEKELKGSGIDLIKMGEKDSPAPWEWLSDQLSPGDVVYSSAATITPAQRDKFTQSLKKSDISFKIGRGLAEELWNDRPPLPSVPIYEFKPPFAEQSRTEKLKALREKMKESGAGFFLATALDEVAYLLNLRGSDVECNPVFLSYLLVSDSDCTLFTQPEKIKGELKSTLSKGGVSIKTYEQVKEDLKTLGETDSVLVDPTTIGCELYDLIPAKIIEQRSPVVDMKAIKPAAAIDHIRNAMARDGAALFKAFNWLKKEIQHSEIKESDLAEKIAECRAEQPHYIGESFPAIVGYKGNGAIVHYKPSPETSSVIQPDGMLLVDSGGQYLDGTTDITRTLHLSRPTAEEKKNFTLVLKGMIALTKAVFPVKTMGVQLDILARKPLWENGLNFGHGTGHGVGYFLNVHEPPQGIVPNLSERGKTPFKEGMITSNEPGYYKTGEYGIRCENLVLCKKAETDGFLQFETLTLFPFERKLIEKELLSDSELQWLNRYHQWVCEKLSPLLSESEKGLLREECKPL